MHQYHRMKEVKGDPTKEQELLASFLISPDEQKPERTERTERKSLVNPTGDLKTKWVYSLDYSPPEKEWPAPSTSSETNASKASRSEASRSRSPDARREVFIDVSPSIIPPQRFKNIKDLPRVKLCAHCQREVATKICKAVECKKTPLCVKCVTGHHRKDSAFSRDQKPRKLKKTNVGADGTEEEEEVEVKEKDDFKRWRSMGHTIVPLPGLIICDDCLESAAICSCPMPLCGLRLFCDSCYQHQHSRPDTRSHVKVKKALEGEQDERQHGGFYSPLPSDLHSKDIKGINQNLITVVVPAFNEDASEVRRTLRSLSAQARRLEEIHYKMVVVLILDGWWKASASTKDYIKRLFPTPGKESWVEQIKEITEGRERECVGTLSLQRVDINGDLGPVSGLKKLTKIERNQMKDQRRRDGQDDPPDEEIPTEEESEVRPTAWQKCGRTFILLLILLGVIGVVASRALDTYQQRLNDLLVIVFFAACALLGFLILVWVLALGSVPSWTDPEADSLYLSVLIKRDNRRKHNSHGWFFASFCAYYQPRYAFCTDAGTLFSKDCIINLVKYMDGNPSAVGATGRQRVMSAEMQGSFDENVIDAVLRKVQCFDYEASLASFMGAFALIGMLPVIPGPCGLYRWEKVQNAVRFYLKKGDQNPDEAGMVFGTLLLAEDRILSYAAVFKSGPGAETVYVPSAIFYFEAETNLQLLLQQRRRWINGTAAGYWWLLYTHRQLVTESERNFCFKGMVLLLVSLQFCLYFFVALAPAINIAGVYFALQELVGRYRAAFPEGVALAYVVVYVAFVQQHSLRKPKNKLKEWLFYIAAILNALGVVLIIAGTAFYSSENGMTVGLEIACAIVGLPFLLALLHSLESFRLMLLTWIPFLLFLPTMVGYLGAYAFSRTWELTWGNRPSDKLASMQAMLSEDEAGKNKEKLYQRGKTISYVIALLNVLLTLFVILIADLQPFFVTALSCVIAVSAFVQMTMSLFWYIARWPRLTFEYFGYTLCGRKYVRRG